MSTLWAKLVESMAVVLVRHTRWSPIGRRVAIAFDGSTEALLVGRTAYGIVRAYGVGSDGTLAELLIETDDEVDHHGDYRDSATRWLVTRPYLEARRTSTLLFSWTAVRIIDASSFVDATDDRIFATGRVWRI